MFTPSPTEAARTAHLAHAVPPLSRVADLRAVDGDEASTVDRFENDAGRNLGSGIARLTSSRLTTLVRAGRLELPPLSGPGPKTGCAGPSGVPQSDGCSLVTVSVAPLSTAYAGSIAISQSFVSNSLAANCEPSGICEGAGLVKHVQARAPVSWWWVRFVCGVALRSAPGCRLRGGAQPRRPGPCARIGTAVPGR